MAKNKLVVLVFRAEHAEQLLIGDQGGSRGAHSSALCCEPVDGIDDDKPDPEECNDQERFIADICSVVDSWNRRSKID